MAKAFHLDDLKNCENVDERNKAIASHFDSLIRLRDDKIRQQVDQIIEQHLPSLCEQAITGTLVNADGGSMAVIPLPDDYIHMDLLCANLILKEIVFHSKEIRSLEIRYAVPRRPICKQLSNDHGINCACQRYELELVIVLTDRL